MTFSYKPGNYIKSSNNTFKIIRKILLLIFFLYVWIIVFYPINNLISYIFNTFFICFFNILMTFLYYKFTKNYKSLLYVIGNTYSLINGFLISMILPLNMPVIITIIIMLIMFLIVLFFDKLFNIKLNYIVMTLLCSYIYLNIYNFDVNYILLLKNSTSLFLILIIVIITSFLIINDCIKWRITITYFVILIGCIFFDMIITKNNDLTYYLNNIVSLFNFIYAIFIINEFKSTSVIPFNQYIYATIVAITMYISYKYNNYYLSFIIVVFLNILNTIFDNLYISLKNKN